MYRHWKNTDSYSWESVCFHLILRKHKGTLISQYASYFTNFLLQDTYHIVFNKTSYQIAFRIIKRNRHCGFQSILLHSVYQVSYRITEGYPKSKHSVIKPFLEYYTFSKFWKKFKFESQGNILRIRILDDALNWIARSHCWYPSIVGFISVWSNLIFWPHKGCSILIESGSKTIEIYYS